MKITRACINNTKIVNLIRKGTELYGAKREVVVGKKNGTELCITMKIELAQDMPADQAKLSCYDCMVMDAVYALVQEQNDTFHVSFSPGQVLRAMSGDPGQTLSAQKKKTILESIEKLQNTHITLGCEEELEARGVNLIKRNIPDGKIPRTALLPVEQKGTRYYLQKDLPLFQYGTLVHQIVTVPYEMLQCSDAKDHTTVNSDENMMIRRCLIWRLELMRNEKNKITQRKITYFRTSHEKGEKQFVGFLADVGIMRGKEGKYLSEDAWKHKRLAAHKVVVEMLDYYVRKGYLEGYRLDQKTRGVIRGVEIVGEIRSPWEIDWESREKEKMINKS